MEITVTEHQETVPIHLDPTRRYYFVGIGGIGMSAIAQILCARGLRVGGADARPSALLDQLRAAGADIYVGHDASQLTRQDVLVLSDAIKADNPEWRQAKAWSLPIIKRADLLGVLTNAGRGVAVSGTHGKTTTSGMLALIFLEAGMDPTCILGGELAPLGSNARAGGDLILVEACEAYNSFLNLTPAAALITNVEVDHLDFHGTPEHLYASFRQFLGQVRSVAVLNGDDPMLQRMTALAPRTVTYGASAGCDYRMTDVVLDAEPSFTLSAGSQALGSVRLRVPGQHNVSNAAGAAALALEMGADFAAVQRGLAAFPGMHRRFERLGHCGHAVVVDDYAHHPTEIRATLAAAREAFSGRVIALFQPHLYSRTRDLLDDFARAFTQADLVLIAPIYQARELPIPGISHHLLVERLAALDPQRAVCALASLDEAVSALAQAAGYAGVPLASITIPPMQQGDVVITIGAGDVNTVAQQLVQY
ncbi:MAG TPA: UDP-N-acetylmuramate--L-alanine ligase [Armatimonadota bacterium]